jgi:hypothetical protein
MLCNILIVQEEHKSYGEGLDSTYFEIPSLNLFHFDIEYQSNYSIIRSLFDFSPVQSVTT